MAKDPTPRRTHAAREQSLREREAALRSREDAMALQEQTQSLLAQAQDEIALRNRQMREVNENLVLALLDSARPLVSQPRIEGRDDQPVSTSPAKPEQGDPGQPP